MAITLTATAGVCYLIDDVNRAIDFYTTRFESPWATTPHRPVPTLPAGPPRLLLSRPTSSGRILLPDGSTPGAWLVSSHGTGP